MLFLVLETARKSLNPLAAHRRNLDDVLVLSFVRLYASPPSYLVFGPAAGEKAPVLATNNVSAPTENFILFCCVVCICQLLGCNGSRSISNDILFCDDEDDGTALRRCCVGVRGNWSDDDVLVARLVKFPGRKKRIRTVKCIFFSLRNWS